MTDILFVDDDRNMKELYMIHGESAGFNTHVCHSGLEALSYLSDHETDIVVMDLAMPDMDGLQTAKEVRMNEDINQKSPVRLFFLTAYDVSETIQRVANEVRAEKIFKKPFDLKTLLSEVRPPSKVLPAYKQTGAASTNWIILFLAVIAQIVTISFAFYLNHRTVDWWAIQWAQEKSGKESMKTICDSNAEKKNALEIVIQQNNIQTSPELLTERPCVVEVEKTEEPNESH